MKTNSMYDKVRWKKKNLLDIHRYKWLIYNVVSSLENIAKKSDY